MSNRCESDEWGTETPSILASERLDLLRATLEQSAVIVEHWFYRGGRAPDRTVFEDFDELHEYLGTKTRPGDSIWIWRYDSVCRENNCLTHGKCPDGDGLVPKKGAY